MKFSIVPKMCIISVVGEVCIICCIILIQWEHVKKMKEQKFKNFGKLYHKIYFLFLYFYTYYHVEDWFVQVTIINVTQKSSQSLGPGWEKCFSSWYYSKNVSCGVIVWSLICNNKLSLELLVKNSGN